MSKRKREDEDVGDGYRKVEQKVRDETVSDGDSGNDSDGDDDVRIVAKPAAPQSPLNAAQLAQIRAIVVRLQKLHEQYPNMAGEEAMRRVNQTIFEDFGIVVFPEVRQQPAVLVQAGLYQIVNAAIVPKEWYQRYFGKCRAVHGNDFCEPHLHDVPFAGIDKHYLDECKEQSISATQHTPIDILYMGNKVDQLIFEKETMYGLFPYVHNSAELHATLGQVLSLVLPTFHARNWTHVSNFMFRSTCIRRCIWPIASTNSANATVRRCLWSWCMAPCRHKTSQTSKTLGRRPHQRPHPHCSWSNTRTKKMRRCA